MTQISSKTQLKSPSCLLWNPKEKAEVSYFSELCFAILVMNYIINRCFFIHSTSGNNIYGVDVRENLLRLQKEGTDGNGAYILMQRIFPTVFPTFLIRDGICHKDYAISELGIYGAYLRYISLPVIQWNVFRCTYVSLGQLLLCNCILPKQFAYPH